MKNFRMSSLRKFATPMLALMIGTTGVSQVGAATIYGFAQQKIYNMTLNDGSGNPANLVATSNLDISTSTSASLSGYAPVASPVLPAIDANQSILGVFATPGLPPGRITPPENYIGNALFASTPGIRVLTQANPTGVGLQNAVDSSIPTIGNFNPGDQFARSDVYATTPNGNPIPASNPLQGAPPASYPANGLGIPSSQLFAPVGAGTTLSFDSAAEGLLNANSINLGNAVAAWVVSGAFNLVNPGSVELSFELVERLAVFSNSSPTPQAFAQNNLQFLITDVNNVPVANPSSTRSLTAPAAGEAVYNGNSLAAGHILNGVTIGSSVAFQSGTLPSGSYRFSIAGFNQVDLKTVPEPSTYVMMGLSALMFGGLQYRRKMQLAKARA
jgi:hypothetical protein